MLSEPAEFAKLARDIRVVSNHYYLRADNYSHRTLPAMSHFDHYSHIGQILAALATSLEDENLDYFYDYIGLTND